MLPNDNKQYFHLVMQLTVKELIMKLAALIKYFSPFALIICLSVNAAIIDLIIDVSANIEDPEGMAWDGTYLWVVDDTSTEMAYQIDPNTGEVISYFSINPAGVDNPDTESITWDGSHLWIADSTGIIGQYTTNGTLVSTITAVLTGVVDYDIEGLTWDGANLWLAEQNTGQIFKIDNTGAVISSYSSGLVDLISINYFGGFLWLGDTNTDDIFKIDPTTFATLDTAFDIDTILTVSGVDNEYDDPYGLTWTGANELWYSDESDEVLVRINMGLNEITDVTTLVSTPVTEPSTLTLFSLLLLFFNRKNIFNNNREAV